MQKYRKALFELISHNQAYLQTLEAKGKDKPDMRPLNNIKKVIERITTTWGTQDDEVKFLQTKRLIFNTYWPPGAQMVNDEPPAKKIERKSKEPEKTPSDSLGDTKMPAKP